jgi:hypothetical protein
MPDLPAVPNDRPRSRKEDSIEPELPADDLPMEDRGRDRFAHLLLTAWSMVLEEEINELGPCRVPSPTKVGSPAGTVRKPALRQEGR